MNHYLYCRGWNNLLWKLGEPMSEDDARRRFTSSDDAQWFSVVAFADGVPDDGVPEWVMEVVPGGSYFGISLFDQTRSLRFVYGQRRVGDRIFLEEITEYTYPDATRRYNQNECSIVDIVTFEPNGLVHERLNDKSKPTVELSGYRDVDVSSHWKPVPEFGDWENIAQFDR